MTETFFGLSALDEQRAFFTTLRKLPYAIVQRFLMEVREYELEQGVRQAWVHEHEKELSLLRALAGPTWSAGAEDLVDRYLRYRLIRRPMTFCLLALYGEDRKYREEFVEIENRQVLDGLAHRGQAAVLLGSHFGPQTVLPVLVAAEGWPVTAVMPTAEQALISRLLAAYGSDSASRISLLSVPDRTLLLKCRARLRQGESVLVCMEFSASDTPSRTRAKLMGLTLPAPEGGVFLAATAGVPIVPIQALYADDLHIRLVVHDPLTVPQKRRIDLEETIQSLWADLELRVLRDPDQWLGWQVLADNPVVMEQILSSAHI